MTTTTAVRLGRLAGHALGRLRPAVRAPAFPGVAAAALGAVAVAEVLRTTAPGERLPTALLLALCTTVPVAFARLQALAATMVIAAAALVTLLTGHPMTIAGLVAHAAAMYLCALRGPLRAAVLLVLPFVAYPLFVLPAGSADSGSPALLVAVASATAVGLGSARRSRRAETERRATDERMAGTLLEHAARGERARIARELHDVVAHHISMISVQAETARLTIPGMPAEGAQRLIGIAETARAALTEMRRLLGVLREDADSAPTRAPQPGLEQLNDLLDEVRDGAAVSARLVVSGQVRALDPGIELTAYRIVQEALTNARRHAPGAAVDVELHYGGAALHLRVRDNGPGPPLAVSAGGWGTARDGGAAASDTGASVTATVASGADLIGHGLVGMRERAAMVGGELSIAAAHRGGLVVTAALPTGDAPAGA